MRKGTERENDPGEGEVLIDKGLIFWEDVAPLSIWVNSLKSGSAVKPHYRAEQKHVGASQMLQGHHAHCQGQRLKEKKEKKKKQKTCRYQPNTSATGEKHGCDESVARKRNSSVNFNRLHLNEDASYLITHLHYYPLSCEQPFSKK